MNPSKKKKILEKICTLQNRFHKKKITSFLLQILSEQNDHKINIIAIEILVLLLKFGNRMIQKSLFNLFQTNMKFQKVFSKLKFYINHFKEQIYIKKEAEINNLVRSKSSVVGELYRHYYSINPLNAIYIIFMLIQYLCENCFLDF